MAIFDYTAAWVAAEIGSTIFDYTAAGVSPQLGNVYDYTAAGVASLVWQAELVVFDNGAFVSGANPYVYTSGNISAGNGYWKYFTTSAASIGSVLYVSNPSQYANGNDWHTQCGRIVIANLNLSGYTKCSVTYSAYRQNQYTDVGVFNGGNWLPPVGTTSGVASFNSTGGTTVMISCESAGYTFTGSSMSISKIVFS